MWFGYLGKQANMSSTQNSLLLKKIGEKKGKDASSCLSIVLASLAFLGLRSGLFCKVCFGNGTRKLFIVFFLSISMMTPQVIEKSKKERKFQDEGCH